MHGAELWGNGLGAGLPQVQRAELDHLPCMALVECGGEVVTRNRLYRELSGDKGAAPALIESLLVGAFPRGVEGRQRFDCLMVRQNGRPMVVSGSAQPVVHGGRAGRLILLMERTDGAASEDGGQTTLFESVLNSLPEAAAITFGNRIFHINHAFMVLFGYKAVECIGRDLNELLVPRERRSEVAAVANAMRTCGRAALETVRTTRAGEEVDVSLQVVPLPLGGGVSGELLTFRDIRAQKMADARLQHEAMHDGLTGIANRALFLDRLRRAMARLERRPERGFSVMFLDLDGFKQANDRYGHAAGDAVLVEVARRMQSCVRPEDTVARLGGDEFALLLDDAVLVRDVEQVAQRLQAAIFAPVETAGGVISVSASIGIAATRFSTPPLYVTAETMLEDADRAMYRVKAEGRGRYAIFSR